MEIALVGATGMAGSEILNEAVNRGHQVTAICRHPEKLPERDGVHPRKADVMDVAALTAAFAGQDAIIHAYAPPRADSIESRIEQQTRGTKSIIAAAKAAGIHRVLAVGGAGTLEVSPGVRHMDTPEFPPEWMGGAKSTGLIKDLLKAEPALEWSFLCPAHFLEPGERTGKFRLGLDELIVDASGESRISTADYAVAMIDELEQGKHIRQRFSIGY